MAGKSDDVKGCGVRDGSTLHVNHRVRGGRDHESKKPNQESNITEKQQKRESQTPVTCQVKTKEESLEDVCSRANEDVVQQDSNTGLNSLGVMEAPECLSQGIDGEVDQKIERFLVGIRNLRSIPPMLTEVLEKFVRLCVCSTDGRSKEPSQTN